MGTGGNLLSLMTNEKILKLAIEKAVKNGLNKELLPAEYEVQCMLKHCWLDAGDELIDAFAIIYSHPFAKAFWGEEPICTICGSDEFVGSTNPSTSSDPGEYFLNSRCGAEAIDINEFGVNDGTTLFSWQYHLQQMVISEDPIKYLEQFI